MLRRCSPPELLPPSTLFFARAWRVLLLTLSLSLLLSFSFSLSLSLPLSFDSATVGDALAECEVPSFECDESLSLFDWEELEIFPLPNSRRRTLLVCAASPYKRI